MVRLLASAWLLSGCDLLFQLSAIPDGAIEGDAINCPGNYVVTVGTSRYRTGSAPVTWLEAEASCVADGPNTHLAVIAVDAERTAINGFTTEQVWIGMSDRMTEGTWRWVSTEPVIMYPGPSGPPWDAGEPSNTQPEEDCGAISGLQGFRDKLCGDLNPFVCECDGYGEAIGTF